MYLDEILQRDRWISFDDSWSVIDVVDAFRLAHVSNHDVVIDPFIGCGTTALVALSRGVTVYGGDLSTLAVFVTQMKCGLVREWDDRQIRAIFEQIPWRSLASAVHQHTLHTLVPAHLVLPVLQIFVVATYRSGWQLEGDMPTVRFQQCVHQLCDEMNHDCLRAQSISPCAVFCDDFRHLLNYIPLLSPAVMITSPPFFGSSVNRLRSLFDTVLRSYMQKHDRYAPLRVICAPPTFSAEIVSQHLRGNTLYETYHDVRKYILFLCDVVEFAVQARCRAVVIEMGPKRVEGRWIHFEYIVSDILQKRGFVVNGINAISHDDEPVYQIYAQAKE